MGVILLIKSIFYQDLIIFKNCVLLSHIVIIVSNPQPESKLKKLTLTPEEGLIISKSNLFGYIKIDKLDDSLTLNNHAAKLFSLNKSKNNTSEDLPLHIKNLVFECIKILVSDDYPFYKSYSEEKFDLRHKFLCLNIDLIVNETAIYLIFCDVSSKHLLEVTLDQKNQFLNNISQNSSVITWVIGIDFVPTFISNSAVDFFGIKNFQEIDWRKIVHQDDYNNCFKTFIKALNSIKPFALEFRGFRIDGQYRWIQVKGSPIFDLYGAIKGFVGTAIDIHDHKQSQIAILEREEWFKTLVQNSYDVITIINSEGKVNFISPSGKRILGYGSELLNNNYYDLIHPDYREKIIESFQENSDLKQGRSTQEYLIKDSHNEWVIVETVSNNLLENDLINGIVLNTRDITYRKSIEKQLEKDAYYDSLTALPNRNHFFDKLGKCFDQYVKNRNYNFALLFLDLDRFKIINDSLGHLVGDELLKNLAKILMESTDGPETCFVARLGGDEFTILVEHFENEEDLIKIAKKINEYVSKEVSISGRILSLTLSIGIASTLNHNYEDSNSILRDADTAMYKAKNMGFGQYAVFDNQMHDKMIKQLEMESEIRKGLVNSEFSLQFQPIFEKETNNILGFEAFIRWNHPNRGLIHPREFLSIASDSGLTNQIDLWAMKKSIGFAKLWQENGIKDIFLSLNISKARFSQNNFSSDILDEIETAGIGPRMIKLEFSEDLLLENEQSFVEKLNILSEKGVKLALDNFGRGYCSLSFLQRYPIYAVKIDKSFTKDINNPKNRLVIDIIEALSQKFDLKIMLEAVDSLDQYNLLKSTLEYDLIQGNYLGKAMDGEKVAQYFLDHQKSVGL